MELAVLPGAVTLHVVAVQQPVVTARVADDGHVAHKLLHVQQGAHLCVSLFRSRVFREGNQTVECLAVSAFLVIAAAAVFESVHGVIVIPVVGTAMETVVRLAHVHHGQIPAVDEHMDGLIFLRVHIIPA